MEESVLATVEFLGLVGYEVLTAYAMKAFWPMNQKKKIIYLFWALLPLALMTMFHSENIGNDTRAYTDLFEAVKEMTLKMVLSNGRFEKGYMLFTYVLTRLFSSRQCVLIAEGAIVYLSLARWLNKWCKAPGLFVCLIVEMLEIDGWMSIQRQALAMAILFFAYDMLIEKRLLRFVVLVILAAQFHAVAYVFLLTWPMLWCTGYHAYLLQRKYPHAEIAFSCPRLRPIINNDRINPMDVHEPQLLQVVCAYRLFMPFASITVSTRECARVRDNLVEIAATKISAGVSTGIGGHVDDIEDKGDDQFEISDGRSVDEVYHALLDHNLQPVMSDYIYV